LLWVNLFTGKKHQIRRQLSEAGYPVVGDDVYGDREFNRDFKKLTGLKRYFLHCSRLSFTRENGKRIEIASKLAVDLQKVLANLK
jgi:23S rRNA pseudouridine955/2504/2580 synthase